MRPLIVAALLACSITASASAPFPKLPLPKRAWAFHGDGVLDLEQADTTQPIALTLDRAPGHFVRVLMPKAFSQLKSYAMTTSSDVQVRSVPIDIAPERHGFDLAASPVESNLQGMFVAQAPDGRAIVISIRFQGKAPSLQEAMRYLKFLKDQEHAFPVEAGPALKPTEATP